MKFIVFIYEFVDPMRKWCFPWNQMSSCLALALLRSQLLEVNSNLVMCESIMFNLEDIKIISSDFLIPLCIFDLETWQFLWFHQLWTIMKVYTLTLLCKRLWHCPVDCTHCRSTGMAFVICRHLSWGGGEVCGEEGNLHHRKYQT